MKSYYDYVIVGAGPCGLALAQYLRHTGKNILIIDSIGVIGGCHRVVRVPFENEMLFTEHGPRIYVSNYKNFQEVLKDMGQDFNNLFVPYRYSIQIEMLKKLRGLSFREVFDLSCAFLLFLNDEDYGKKSTIKQFARKHNFSPSTIDILDRTARMTDGAGADRYTMNLLFQLINQSFFYSIYQPKLPNDVGLFRIWEKFLRKQTNIDIVLEHDVINLSYNKEINSINSIWALDKKNHNTIEIKCHNVILAVPPHAIARILKNCHENVKNTFMPFQRLENFVEKNDYIPYISITFHWETKQDNIPSIQGFPVGEWGVIFIVLSDYMDLTMEYSKTLISCCVSYVDKPSEHTGKTANQSTQDEVIEETFRQLKTIMPFLSKPDIALVSPQNSYNTKLQEWTQHDVSYFDSGKQSPLKNLGKINNLYNVGTHNGNSIIEMTTMESAISNALALAYQLDPKTRKLFPFQKIWTLRDMVKFLAYFLLFLLVIIILVLSIKNKKINSVNKKNNGI